MAFPLITGGLEVGIPHLVTPGCKEKSYAVPEQGDVLADQSFQCLTPKERHRDEQLSILFMPIVYPYESTNPQDGGMLCTEASGQRALT